MSESRVSVVVVSYNTREKLRRCLSCIEPEHEVIVVDNASSDGSAEMVRNEFPRAKLIENSGNVGFGAANNQGMDLATRELVLLLNSDCYAEPWAIACLECVFEDDRIVACGGHLLNADGSTQNSSANDLTLWSVFCEQLWLEKLAPRSRFFAPYWNTNRLIQRHAQIEDQMRSIIQQSIGSDPSARISALFADLPTQTAQVMGACLMLRPCERFDERYFLYCEDTDLCKRLSQHGQIVYVPPARFTHELGSSSAGAARWLAVARYNRGKELYFSIHHGAIASAVCWCLDRFGALFRLAAYGLLDLFTLGRKHAIVKLWWKVLTAPAKGPDHR